MPTNTPTRAPTITPTPVITSTPSGVRDKAAVLAQIANANGIISGQSMGSLWRTQSHDEFDWQHNVGDLYPMTGKWAAMIGINYGMTWFTAADFHAMNQFALDYWRSGGLVQIDLHAMNPWTNGDSWDMGRGNMMDLVTPGNAAYTKWNTYMNTIHTALAELDAAGVVVLWRPMLEMTAHDCFWWGLTEAEWQSPSLKATHIAGYVAIWRDMHNRFSDLDNLLWVYGAANKDYDPDYGGIAADEFWPGDAYVDIGGISLYESAPYGDPATDIIKHGKPYALTEFGGPAQDGSVDLMNRLNYLKTSRAKYVLFWHSWSSGDGLVAIRDQRNAVPFMNDAYVITRDELWR